jgi:hypothetical protein
MEQPQQIQPQSPQTKPTNTLGIVSLVTGIIGFIVLALPMGIVALTTGLVEKPRSGLAVAGIVLGIVDIAFGIFNILVVLSI